MDVGPVGIVGVHLLLGPDKELLGGAVLVGGNTVDPVANPGGIEEVGGDRFRNTGGLGQQVGQIGEGAHLHVVGIGAGVGEHDVIGLVGLDDDGAALAPGAPLDALDIDVHADLFLQIGVGLLRPGADVGGLAAAHHVPGDDRIAALLGRRGRGRGVVAGSLDVGLSGIAVSGRLVVAAATSSQQGQRHDRDQEQSK